MQNIIKNPYHPLNTVSKIIISADTSFEIINSLSLNGISVILTSPLKGLSSPLSKHADIQLVNLSEGIIVHSPDVCVELLNVLKNLGFELIQGETSLKNRYPFDIAYNCAIVGSYAFLNTRYSDANLIKLLKRSNIKIIHVNQGYAKCSTCVINSEAIITADVSIHKNAIFEGIDSLLIPPQNNIKLEGYKYGFIGGASGMISENKLAFFGDYKTLEQANIIEKHIAKYGVQAVSLSHEKLVDLGGLIPLCSV